MAEYTAAQAAFGRAASLAAAHHAALDSAARLMSANAWVGGGAPAFAADLSRYRTQLQSSLTTALHALASQVVRQGGPPPAIPLTTSSVASIGAAPGSFQGIDVTAMTTLISTL